MSNDNLDNRIEQERPTLTADEKAAMLRAIEAKVVAPTLSPYSVFLYLQTKTMTGVLVALVLIVGTTGTVAASNDAKPGDLLFPIERATERVQLAFAGEAREAELRAQFSAERLAELREIIEEETESTEVETTASSSASTSASVTVRESGEERIARAITAVLDSLEGYEDADARVEVLTKLQTDIDHVKIAGRSDSTVNVKTEDGARVQIKDDRIEVRDDGFRLRIDGDGEVRLRVGDDSDDDSRGRGSDDDDDSDDDSEDEFRSSNSLQFEAEADVFFDTTIVEIEINDRKSTFETTADTRSEVIDEIVSRYDVDRAAVDAVLDFEIEDRNSRSDDSDDDEWEGEDEWEDEDDHHSGRGSDDDDEWEDNDDFDDDSDDRDEDEGVAVKKFEVRVEGSTAEVRVEYGNKKLEYDTVYTTKAALIAEVALRTGLTSAELGSTLDLEID
ncbi:MAG: hypothetical protein KC877_02725 [Candidatus Kaiserbacteria bacterium]|nr:hypothetical protein [Candidatus Kaiserbacteria bacterium]MCB9816654.1 hypothetical protein [Candidatus Nomurabacteria bacterium]